MKAKHISTLSAMLALFVASCTFRIGPEPSPSGNGGGGTGSSSITFLNPTFTDVTVTFNGSTKVITPFGTETYTGTSGKTATYHAETFGKTSTGVQLGEKVSYDKSVTFSSVPQTIYLDVPADYFFLMLINTSGSTISKLYTNTSTTATKAETVAITSGTTLINVGYYKSVTGSSLKAEFTNGTSQTFASLSLTGSANQSYTAIVTGAGTGGGTGGTGGTATLVINNKTFTDITFTLNGDTKTIATGGSVAYSGNTNATATYTGETSGKTTSGTQVGLKLTWSNTNSFPASGSKSIDLQISSDYFFVFVTNNSSKDIQKVYVNFGLSNQTLDNVVFAKGGNQIQNWLLPCVFEFQCEVRIRNKFLGFQHIEFALHGKPIGVVGNNRLACRHTYLVD